MCLGFVLRRAKTDRICAYMSMEKAIQLRQQAWALESEGRLEEARSVFCEALHLVEVCPGPESLAAADFLNDLAALDKERLSFQPALAAAERALAIENLLDGAVQDETVARIQLKTLSLLGGLRRTLGDYSQAEENLREALAVATSVFGENSEEFAQALGEQASLYKHWGRFDEGVALYQRSLKIISDLQGEQNFVPSY